MCAGPCACCVCRMLAIKGAPCECARAEARRARQQWRCGWRLRASASCLHALGPGFSDSTGRAQARQRRVRRRVRRRAWARWLLLRPQVALGPLPHPNPPAAEPCCWQARGASSYSARVKGRGRAGRARRRPRRRSATPRPPPTRHPSSQPASSEGGGAVLASQDGQQVVAAGREGGREGGGGRSR